MDYKKEIDAIIETALAEKTFNLDIIDEIKKLKDLAVELEEVRADLTEKNTLVSNLRDELADQKSALETSEGELASLREREEKLREKELRAEFADTRLADYKEMVGLVFRNPVLKEQTFRHSNVQRESGGCIMSYPEDENSTVERSVE